jgi:hypothetical protein
MNAAPSGPMILAIGAQDNFLHVYHDAQELLQDRKVGAAGQRSGPLEFFDSAGYRLVGQYSQEWKLRGLTRTEEPPNRELIRQRVQNCIDHLRGYLKSHAEEIESPEMTVDEALARCPDLGGPSNVEAFLQTLTHQRKGEVGVAHPTSDPWHNLWHGSGWQD